MPTLPLISGSACVAALAKIGYRTVPIHLELDRGTLRSIIRTAEISVEEFVKLVA